MVSYQYREPYSESEKQAYKAGIRKGKEECHNERLPELASTDTPASRSARALEQIASLLDQHLNAYINK